MVLRKMNIAGWRLVLGIVVFFSGVLIAGAQSTVTINGTVKDSSGASVAGATVTVTNVQTGIQNTSPVDASGHYTVLSIPAGFYDVQAAMQGFATSIRRNQEFLVGTTVTLDFTLSVSTVTQTVEVQGVTPDVEPTQSTVDSVLRPTQLDDLPIQSRNFSQLAALTPGVQTTSQVSVGFAVGGAVTGVTIGNSAQYETGYMIDNIPIVKPSDGGLYVALAQDWVQEFSVTANQAPAEYVGAVSGFINAITRSGTNSIHGRAYTFIQNSALNASNTNLVTPITFKAPTSSQRYGGMVGGPVIKDKLFYFAGYEYFKSTAGAIFSGVPSNLAGSQQVLPGDLVSASYPNPSSQTLAELKITWQINQSNQIDLIGNLQELFEPAGVTGGFTSPYNGNNTQNGNYAEAVDWRHTFSPTAINELRFNSARDWDHETCLLATQKGPFQTSTPPLTSYGTTPYGNPTGYYASLAYAGGPGGNTVTVGCNGRWGGDHFIGLYAGFYDTFTKTKGRHEVKFGGNTGDPYYGLNAVRVNFDGAYGFNAPASGALIPFSATNPASFPLKYSVTWAPPNRTYAQSTGWNFGIFAQDTWRVTDKLTVNSGIRWDADYSYSYFNAHFIAPGGNPVNNDFRTIAPRIGVSWAPFADQSTVIRGGFGVYYSPTSLTLADGYISTRFLPQVLDTFVSNSVGQNPYCISPGGCATTGAGAATFAAYQKDLGELMAWALANNTLPDLTKTSVSVGGTTYALPGFTGTIPQSGVYNIDQDQRNPAAYQVTIGGARTFWNNLNVTADFVFMHGFDQDLTRNTNVNPELPVTPSGGVNVLNPAYTTYNSVGSIGYFNNKQLLAKARYTNHRGDFVAVAYTLGFSEGDSPAGGDFVQHALGVVSTNPLNPLTDNGPTLTDQRNSIAINGLGRLPYLGIELAPIITFGTGLPITPTTTLQAGGTQTVQIPGGGTNVVTVPGCQVYWSQCYAAINGRYYGNGSLRGADTFMFSARAQRTFKFGEGSKSITPLFEAYNIPNYVNKGTSFTTLATSTSFDKPSSATITMRQLQVGARFDF
jgi:hypothetical protein